MSSKKTPGKKLVKDPKRAKAVKKENPRVSPKENPKANEDIVRLTKSDFITLLGSVYKHGFKDATIILTNSYTKLDIQETGKQVMQRLTTNISKK